jgi:predicted transposase/invertase (TIGR01784 family)
MAVNGGNGLRLPPEEFVAQDKYFHTSILPENRGGEQPEGQKPSRRLFPDDTGIHRFEYYDREAGIGLDGRTHIVVVELEKAGLMAKKPPETLSRGEKWALFFRYAAERGRRELVNELLRDEEGIAMAGEALLTVSRDEMERARLDSEFKYELDWQSHMIEARQEGLAEGRAEGLAEAARRMKRDGLTAGQIAAYTGLSLEETGKL